jgi:hypothetical protein
MKLYQKNKKRKMKQVTISFYTNSQLASPFLRLACDLKGLLEPTTRHMAHYQKNKIQGT